MGFRLLAVYLCALADAEPIAPYLLPVAMGDSDREWTAGAAHDSAGVEMTTITGIDDFPTACATLPIPLADGRHAVAYVHFPTPGTSEIAYSAAYLVDSLGRASKVGQSEPFGKDIACALSINGTLLRLWVTEPPPGGGGAQSQAHWYDFPIGIGLALGGGGVDQATLARISHLESAVAAHEGRLDRGAAGLTG